MERKTYGNYEKHLTFGNQLYINNELGNILNL